MNPGGSSHLPLPFHSYFIYITCIYEEDSASSVIYLLYCTCTPKPNSVIQHPVYKVTTNMQNKIFKMLPIYSGWFDVECWLNNWAVLMGGTALEYGPSNALAIIAWCWQHKSRIFTFSVINSAWEPTSGINPLICIVCMNTIHLPEYRMKSTSIIHVTTESEWVTGGRYKECECKDKSRRVDKMLEYAKPLAAILYSLQLCDLHHMCNFLYITCIVVGVQSIGSTLILPTRNWAKPLMDESTMDNRRNGIDASE